MRPGWSRAAPLGPAFPWLWAPSRGQAVLSCLETGSYRPRRRLPFRAPGAWGCGRCLPAGDKQVWASAWLPASRLPRPTAAPPHLRLLSPESRDGRSPAQQELGPCPSQGYLGTGGPALLMEPERPRWRTGRALSVPAEPGCLGWWGARPQGDQADPYCPLGHVQPSREWPLERGHPRAWCTWGLAPELHQTQEPHGSSPPSLGAPGRGALPARLRPAPIFRSPLLRAQPHPEPSISPL